MFDDKILEKILKIFKTRDPVNAKNDFDRFCYILKILDVNIIFGIIKNIIINKCVQKRVYI